MTVVLHELRRGRLAFCIWTGVISFMLLVTVILYPEMKGEMEGLGDMFASMGSFTSAFGMDKLNFGTLIGYYAIECGNVLGLGGALFAALTAVRILSKEERDGTVDFLLTHPVSRARIITGKLVAVLLQIISLEIIVFALSLCSITAVGEDIPWKAICLLHLSNSIMHIEIACVCFGISAFMRRGSAGAGLGLAIMLYFLNILANLSDKTDFLKYITPFGYCDGSDIVANRSLDGVMILIGAAFAALGVILAYIRYCSKDVQ